AVSKLVEHFEQAPCLLGPDRILGAFADLPESFLDLRLFERKVPGLDLLGFGPARPAPLAVVELLDAVKRQGLTAECQADAENRLDLKLGVVFEVAALPLEHLEEQTPGELLDAQRKPVVAVETAVEDEPRQVDGCREVACEQVVEGRRGEGAAAKQVHAETMSRERAGNIDDLPLAPVDDAAVAPLPERQSAGAPI